MAVKNRESLVLCGSTVLMGGTTGNARLGTDYSAEGQTPEIRISMRHPSHGCEREFQPAMRSRPTDTLRVDSAIAYGAGRSRSRAGVLSQRSRLRPTNANATTLSMAGVNPTAIAVVKRCSIGPVWSKPAGRTPPSSTWGTGVR